MSLFVCQNPDCQAIENSSCMSIGKDRDSDYPNMCTMDMHGYHEEPIYIGKVMKQEQVVLDHNNSPIDMSYKLPGTVLMLCSECNTGKWHDEFPKDKANEEELKLAKLSPYSYITPGFHMDNQIVKDDSCRHGYRAPTEEELFAYGRRTSRRASPATMAIAGIISRYLPNFGSKTIRNRTTNRQSEEDKTRNLRRAELKREIKQMKKDSIKTNPKLVYNSYKAKLQALEDEYKTLK